MKMTCLTAAIVLAGSAASAAPTLAQLGGGHRILIVSSAGADRELAVQRGSLASWRQQADARDIATIVLDGAKVKGASDAASQIRERYAIPAHGFALALVGKDGHVAYRASKPVTGVELEQVIDAMPMRRSGQR